MKHYFTFLSLASICIIFSTPIFAQLPNENLALTRVTYAVPQPSNTSNAHTDKQSKLRFNRASTIAKILSSPAIKKITCFHRVEGYTIFLYKTKSKEEVVRLRRKVYYEYNQYPGLKYKKPFYKLMAGRFTKLEACKKVLKKLKKEFPNAVIVPTVF